MKNLLISTGIMSIAALGLNSTAHAHTQADFTSEQFEQVFAKLDITSTATGLETGDIHATSHGVIAPLYSGQGSAAMSTIRAFRF